MTKTKKLTLKEIQRLDRIRWAKFFKQWKGSK